MIKMYANDKPDDWHRGCGVVPDKDKNFCYECYLLTASELEQLAREAFIAGETSIVCCGTYKGCGNLQETFADYWQEKQKEIKK